MAGGAIRGRRGLRTIALSPEAEYMHFWLYRPSSLDASLLGSSLPSYTIPICGDNQGSIFIASTVPRTIQINVIRYPTIYGKWWAQVRSFFIDGIRTSWPPNKDLGWLILLFHLIRSSILTNAYTHHKKFYKVLLALGSLEGSIIRGVSWMCGIYEEPIYVRCAWEL